ncbi:hypothetical protein DFH06DRAFT_143916 [Mycena polygramma]|nr:hypothetical protein DFH06DRAFT_143916 [Mycena polygramma]
MLDNTFYFRSSVSISVRFDHRDELCEIPKVPYLFLSRPTGDLVDGHFSARIPPLEDFFNWSFDRDGGRRLNDSSVELLRLPRLTYRIHGAGRSWTASQYQSLTEAHKAKGFDLDSPDVAISLGYPLMTPNDESRFAECGDNDTQCVVV